MTSPYQQPVQIIERVELVRFDEARRSVEENKPLITDRFGDWFVMKCESRLARGVGVARLRLAIPVGDLTPAIFSELNHRYAVS